MNRCKQITRSAKESIEEILQGVENREFCFDDDEEEESGKEDEDENGDYSGYDSSEY